MDKTMLMCMFQDQSDLDRHRNSFLLRNCTVFDDQVFQGAAFHILLDDVAMFMILAEIDHPDYIRVVKAGCGLGFYFETLDERRVVRQLIVHDLGRGLDDRFFGR